MLRQSDVWLWNPLGKAVLDHGVCALRRFFPGLKERDERALPAVLVLGENAGRAHEPRDVHVVPADMGDPGRLPEAVDASRGDEAFEFEGRSSPLQPADRPRARASGSSPELCWSAKGMAVPAHLPGWLLMRVLAYRIQASKTTRDFS